MNLIEAIRKNKIKDLRLKPSIRASISENTVISAVVQAYNETETTHTIEVQERLWSNEGGEKQLIGTFNFSTNCFNLVNKWIREGSKFLGTGPMDTKNALVEYMKLCQDCSNFANLLDNGLSWTESLEKMVQDREIYSTECDHCETWLPQVIQKYVIKELNTNIRNLIEGVYRMGRRIFVNLLPTSLNTYGNSEQAYLEQIQNYIGNLWQDVLNVGPVNYSCNIDEEAFRKKSFNAVLTEPIKHSEFTKIWPKYRKGPYMFTVTDDQGISTMQPDPPVLNVLKQEFNSLLGDKPLSKDFGLLDDKGTGLKTVIPKERQLEGLAECHSQLVEAGLTDLADKLESITGKAISLKPKFLSDTHKLLDNIKKFEKLFERYEEEYPTSIRNIMASLGYLNMQLSMANKSYEGIRFK